MYRASSKRKKRAQLFFIYSLMVTAVIAIVSILILIILGYRFNKFDGQIEQGGLVQFDSRPSGATVQVDSTVLSNKTASKITLTTGDHAITMSRDGFSTWKKDVTVRAGSILWLNYALLFPTKPTTKTIYEAESISSALTSPDRKYLATLASANTPTITLTPINDSTPISSTVAISEASYTTPQVGKESTFTLVDWDKDSRRMIVRHNYNDVAVEYLAVDLRGQEETRNITRIVGSGVKTLEYSLADSNEMYVLTDGHEVRQVTLSNTTVSGPLLTNVDYFSQGDRSTITYGSLLDPVTNHRSLGYWTTSSTTPRVVKTVTDTGSTPATILMSTYYGDQYIVLTQGTDVQILTGDIPVSDSDDKLSMTQVARYSLPSAAVRTGFSPTERRFVFAEYAGGVWTFDLEIKSLSKTNFEGQAPVRALDWINPYHFATTTGGLFAYYDFDGTNRQLVASKTVDLPVSMSDNNRYMYHFATTDKGVILVQTKLTAN